MTFFASLLNLGGPDLIWILLLILLLFGAKKLPELARGMGQAIKEFQKAKDEFTDELHKADQPGTKANPPASTVPQNPPSTAARPDPNQSANPGDKAGQV